MGFVSNMDFFKFSIWEKVKWIKHKLIIIQVEKQNTLGLKKKVLFQKYTLFTCGWLILKKYQLKKI